MINYDQALNMAKKYKSGINFCEEYDNMFIFCNTNETEIGSGPIGIVKQTGKVMNYLASMEYCGKLVKEFEI